METYVHKILSSGITLTVTEIYDSTISEISSLLQGYNNRMKIQKIFFGTLTASVYNANKTKKGTKMLSWSDIYPDRDSAHTSNQPMTNEQIKHTLMSAFGGFR